MRFPALLQSRLLRFAVLVLLLLAGWLFYKPQDSRAVFQQARARGVLAVGVPYLAPQPAPGAKVRTPERIDIDIAQRLGKQLGLPVIVKQVDTADAQALLASGAVDLVLADQDGDQSDEVLPEGIKRVPTGYVVQPQAVIRSDTSLRRWSDASDHTVCMADAALSAQALARHWGAKVQTYPVPSAALVAVREGKCDLGLVDDTVRAPLMGYPEWKKYAATLPLDGPVSARVWLVRGQPEAGWLNSEMHAWRGQGAWKAMTAQWARDVAFDVYLDQEVADCHGSK
jgi:polar amino acid transport system substrate-binding protein